MHPFEDTVIQYLKTMGVVITQQFVDIPGTNPTVRYIGINHMNVNMGIMLDGAFIYPYLLVGYLPKQSVAPLFRRLLNLNGRMGGPFFSVGDDNSIALIIMRQQEGLDLAEIKWMLDQMGAMYWQNGPGLVQEFQIPPQPM